MTRFIAAGVALALGVWLIYVGVMNVRTRTAEETGPRRRVNRAIGQSNTYTGGKAVLQGWLRIGMGIAAIAFAIWMALFGPES